MRSWPSTPESAPPAATRWRWASSPSGAPARARRASGAVLLLALVGLWLPAPLCAAGTLQLFERSSGAGNRLSLAGPVVGLTVTVDYRPDTAELGGLYGFDITIGVTGDLSIDSFLCDAADCDVNSSTLPQGFRALGGDVLLGEFGPGDLTLGRILISGTSGTLEILAGTYVDASILIEQTIEPRVLVQVGDADGDGQPDGSDNCPHQPNPSQLDSGGVGAGAPADGIGDVCQCGDVNDDGAVDDADVERFRLLLADPVTHELTLAGAAKCTTLGEPSGCDLLDVVVLRRALADLELEPGIQPACSAARP